MIEVEPLANYHCVTGENPLWHAEERRIYWEDIETGRLFRADPETSEHECFFHGDRVGGFTFQADGSLLLFEDNRIARLERNGTRRVLVRDIDAAMVRFNDVIADPEGRVYAGTIGSTDDNGGLFCVERDGSVRLLWRGTGCANGMGFTPDGGGFYWTCSTTRRIYRADYDRASGALSGRRVIHVAGDGEGTPDGLAVDSRGHLWSARWDGHAVHHLDAQACPVDRLTLPLAKVSSITFGGPELNEAYVTTAGGTGGVAGGIEGTLFRVRGLGAVGQAEQYSKILL